MLLLVICLVGVLPLSSEGLVPPRKYPVALTVVDEMKNGHTAKPITPPKENICRAFVPSIPPAVQPVMER